jgi:hypothetical protein
MGADSYAGGCRAPSRPLRGLGDRTFARFEQRASAARLPPQFGIAVAGSLRKRSLRAINPGGLDLTAPESGDSAHILSLHQEQVGAVALSACMQLCTYLAGRPEVAAREATRRHVARQTARHRGALSVHERGTTVIRMGSFALYLVQETVGLPGLPKAWLEPSRLVALLIELTLVLVARARLAARAAAAAAGVAGLARSA